VSELRRLREENGRLKRLVVELSLDKQMLQEIVSKSCKARAAAEAWAVGPANVSDRAGSSGQDEWERTRGEHRQVGWRMALYLEGKPSVDTNELSPKEATRMSHDVK
jgi:hypothetical protein